MPGPIEAAKASNGGTMVRKVIARIIKRKRMVASGGLYSRRTEGIRVLESEFFGINSGRIQICALYPGLETESKKRKEYIIIPLVH